jgi:hypothetical protein
MHSAHISLLQPAMPVAKSYPCILLVSLDALSEPTSGLDVLGPAHGPNSQRELRLATVTSEWFGQDDGWPR